MNNVTFTSTGSGTIITEEEEEKEHNASEIRHGLVTPGRDLIGPSYGASGLDGGQESGIYTEEKSEDDIIVSTSATIDVNILLNIIITHTDFIFSGRRFR